MEYGVGDKERWHGEGVGSTRQTESSVRLVKRARRMGIDFGGYGMINMRKWKEMSYCHAAQMSKAKRQ